MQVGAVTHQSRGRHHVCTDPRVHRVAFLWPGGGCFLPTSSLPLEEERLRPVPMHRVQRSSSSSAQKCPEPPACLGEGPADPVQLEVGGRDMCVACPGRSSSPPRASPGTTVPTSLTPACESGLSSWNNVKTEGLLVDEPVCHVSLCEEGLLHPVLLVERDAGPWCQFFLQAYSF